MKRASVVFTVLFVMLASSALSWGNVGRFATSPSPATSHEAVAFSTRGPSLTIVFRGLMLFHPDPAHQYFDAGILSAPEHQLRIQVLERSSQGVSSSFVPLDQFVTSKSDVWSLEFPKQTQGVSFYQNGSFDRKSGLGDSRDFRWLVDLQGADFYNHKLQLNTAQLSVLFHVTSGEFYTKSTTLPLMRKKGNGAFEFFGRAAEEIATDVFLGGGDMILKSKNSGNVVFKLKEKPDTTYEVVIENVPAALHDMSLSFDHFQYYYRLFPVPRADWYQFKVAPQGNPTLSNHFTTTRVPCIPADFGG